MPRCAWEFGCDEECSRLLCDTHDAEALREFNYPPERMQSETALGAESEPADMADDMMDEEPPERSQSPVISDLRTAEANVLTRKLPLILRQLQDGEAHVRRVRAEARKNVQDTQQIQQREAQLQARENMIQMAQDQVTRREEMVTLLRQEVTRKEDNLRQMSRCRHLEKSIYRLSLIIITMLIMAGCVLTSFVLLVVLGANLTDT